MKDYKQWTGKQRLASWNITKKAITKGELSAPSKCSVCGKADGRIDYHSENYDDPINGLIEMCQSCHLKLHRDYNKQLKNNSSQ